MIPTRLINVWKRMKTPSGACSWLKLSTRSKHDTCTGICQQTHDTGGNICNKPKIVESSSVRTASKVWAKESPIILRVRLAQNPGMLFSVVQNHYKEISTSELSEILSILDKQHPGNYPKDGIHDHPGFIRICNEVRSKSLELPHFGLYCSVFVICKYGAENETTRGAVESLKQPLLEMDWKGVLFSLISLEKSHLLKGRLPFVSELRSDLIAGLESKLWSAVKSEKRFDEVEALCGSCRFLESEDLQRILVNIVMERHPNLTADQSKRLLTGIPRKAKWGREGREFVRLWNRAMSTFTLNMSKFRAKDFAAVCFPWENYVWNRGRSILPLPDDFCAGVARRAVDEKWPWNICTVVAKSFAKKGFVDGNFLEHCIEQEMATGRQVLGLRALGKLNYKPLLFESYFKFCARSLMQGQDLCYSLLSCAVFGFYPLPLIKQLFSNAAQISTWMSEPDEFLEELSALESLRQAVSVECPRYAGPFPPEDLPAVVHRKLERLFVRRPIDDYLIKAAGGPSYVASRLFPKTGFHISNLVVRSAAGSLVPFNDSPGEAEARDLEAYDIPSGHEKIAILLHQEHDFLCDGKSLRGYNLLETRVMEKLGFRVVNINVRRFFELPEEERIPFLLNEIHSL